MRNYVSNTNWTKQSLRLAIAVAALTIIPAFTSGCSRSNAAETQNATPKITSVGTLGGCKITKEQWFSEKGKLIADAYYLEKDGYVLKVYRSYLKGQKRHFRFGRADVPKPDYNRLVSGVFTANPVPQELLSENLRRIDSKAIDFAASLSESGPDIVAATAPWAKEAIHNISIAAFEPRAEIEPRVNLCYAVKSTNDGIAYILKGPWWIDSWIVLDEDDFTVYIDTRDSSRFSGAYSPQKGTAVITGTYDGNLSSGRIQGTELSEYRTGLLRDSTAELEALVPFVGSRLYKFPKALAERCRRAAQVLKAADKLTWEGVVPEDSILVSTDWAPKLFLAKTEVLDGKDLYISFRWSPPKGTEKPPPDISSILLHEDGSIEIDFQWGGFTYSLVNGNSSVRYEHDPPGESLPKAQLSNLTSFLAAVDAGLIIIPEHYAAAYKHLEDFVADPRLPKGRKVEKLNSTAHHL
jgi:hypothetical protein